MDFDECARCGRRVAPGQIRYIVRLTIVGDDGGTLVEVADPDAEIESLIAQIEQMEPDELERDVLEERIFVLCPSCRKAFLRNPFGTADAGTFEDDEDFSGPIQ